MTKIINVIFLFLFSFSLIHGENLTDKYREMMNAKTNNVQSKPSTQETIAPPATPLGNLIDSIKEIKKLKQGTFESTTDFNTRRDDKISQLQNTIKPFAKKGSKDYSAGSANMKSYDADNEIMTLTLLWNNEIKSIFPKAKEIKTVLMNISRADAKELFAKEKTHNFHIKITYKGDKLTISSMWINDKYELRKRMPKKSATYTRNSHKPLEMQKQNRATHDMNSQTSNDKVISFSENGIGIHIIYPAYVKAGQSFKIRAEMTNKYSRAKQGGLTLSFPDMVSMDGTVLDNDFTTVKGYGYPEKIYNKQARRGVPAKYFMVEGWQSRRWYYGKTKTFSVEFVAPRGLNRLSVNVRAVLWIRNKHDVREIPTKSYIYDQQGFSVKRFLINIEN